LGASLGVNSLFGNAFTFGAFGASRQANGQQETSYDYYSFFHGLVLLLVRCGGYFILRTVL
jgi:hypothetical protein